MWFVEKTSAQGKSALRLLLLCEELTLLGSRLGHHLSLESEEALVRIDLKSYGPEQELYVEGILVLANKKEMDAREALEAISGFSNDVQFLASDLQSGGTMRLFDDRFFVKGSGGSAGGDERTA